MSPVDPQMGCCLSEEGRHRCSTAKCTSAACPRQCGGAVSSTDGPLQRFVAHAEALAIAVGLLS